MERRLKAAETSRVLFENASQVVLDDPAAAFGPAAHPEERIARRFPNEMALQLGGGTSATQTVMVELGLPVQSPDAVVFELTWNPVGHAHLLPVLRGSLELAPDGLHTRLSFVGTYTPPLGPVGAFGDGLVGHRVARRTVSTFLESVVRRIDEEVDRRMVAGMRPEPHPSQPTPENWLG